MGLREAEGASETIAGARSRLWHPLAMSRAQPNWFIALPVEPGSWMELLGEPPSGVRVFAPGDLHVTVAFLGAVDEAAASDAFCIAEAWPTAPIPVRLGPLRPLGAHRKPSALSATISEGTEPVAGGIVAVRDEMLDVARARPDTRAPLPHVTLARITRRASTAERRAALAWAEGLDLGAPRVMLDRIALYTWSADRRTRLFDVVEERRIAEG